MVKKMEILSPAGNFDSVLAAVRSGADAVYLGLKEFSARRNAENFDVEGLKKAAEYCHRAGVKIYVTVNTMIKEHELPAAVNAVADAYGSGADAFIVSDLGLISVLHNLLPEIPLHASTQMTVHSPAAIKSLKEYGIKRVVLAREMSRGEIKEFCLAAQKENIEVEVFVHGALCMCVSGQCLLSSILGGRSGNRGLCAGPCRLEFSAAGSGRNDLSLKDLSLIDYLKELENIGVASAKIEGRMKRPEYVAAATAACKAALCGKREPELEGAIKSVFSRSGFTDGYYTGNLGKDMFGVRTKEDVLNSPLAFSYLHALYRGERQSVPVNIEISIKAGENTVLTITDGKGNKAVATGEIPQAARLKSADAESIRAAVSKFGGTPYLPVSIKVTLDGNLYIGISALNALRREATEKLNLLRSGGGRKISAAYGEKAPPSRDFPPAGKLYARFLSAEQIPDNLSGVDGVILPFELSFNGLPEGVVKIADLPRYIADDTAVVRRLAELKAEGVTAAYCGNLAAIAAAKSAGLKCIAANGLNCANGESVSALKNLGADEIILSAETFMTDAKRLANYGNVGLFAYGRLPLMLTRNCPIKNAKTCRECGGKSALKDRKGILFPVVCRKGYSEVLNSTPIYLADKGEDIKEFDFLLLNFTDESAPDARRIIEEYKSGGKAESFTRGVYYKNIP
ncbi:MAG: U32 family peptidase [Clostridia bacterium]|nr:U32 family peptidase [Clostridia bacterium]